MKSILQVALSAVLASGTLLAASVAHARIGDRCVTALEARPAPVDESSDATRPDALRMKPRCPQAVVFQSDRPAAGRADAPRATEQLVRSARPVNASRA